MKHKDILLILVSLIVSSDTVIPQTTDNQINNNSDRLTRVRSAFGYVRLLSEDNNFEFRHLFFNLSYRTSGFDKNSSLFKIKFAFEPGVNGLIISHKYVDKVDLYFTPYAKFGPEIKLSQNLFLGSCLGIVWATYESAFIPLPFFGLNGFYILELNKNFALEFESGFHSTFSQNKLPLLVYFTVGVSIF